jgi:hypothetical protein
MKQIEYTKKRLSRIYHELNSLIEEVHDIQLPDDQLYPLINEWYKQIKLLMINDYDVINLNSLRQLTTELYSAEEFTAEYVVQ